MVKIRISFVSTVAEWGGSEVLWTKAACLAVEQGHEVTVFLGWRDLREEPWRTMGNLGVRFKIRPKELLWPSFSERLIRKFSGRPWGADWWWNKSGLLDADLIVVNQGGAYCAMNQPGLIDAIYNSGIKYILLGRGDTEFTNLSDANIDVVRKFFLNAEGYVAAAQSTIKLMRLQLAGNFKRSFVVHSPITDFSSEPLRYPSVDSGFRMALVARYSQDTKGHHILMACLAEQKWRSRPLFVDCYGSGPDRLRLNDLTKFLNLQDRVFWRGQTNDIKSVWGSAHIAVLPSRYEGTPQAILEAMQCSRAAIATRVGGVPDWIIDGETGFLAESCSIEHIDQALERAWSSRESWNLFGENARSYFQKSRISNPALELLNIIQSCS